MRLIIRYPDGTRSDALLLLEAPDLLRVTIPGYDDVVELRRVADRWVDEAGRRVSIEAMLTPSPLLLAALRGPADIGPKPAPPPLVRRAGSTS